MVFTPAPPPLAYIPFKSHPVQCGMHVWMPSFSASNPKVGAYLWLHGGGFISGKPLDATLVQVDAATKNGFAFLATEYRLAPQARMDSMIDDAVAATKFVLEGHLNEALNDITKNTPGDGIPEIDTARIILGGSSAGGYLSLQTIAHYPVSSHTPYPYGMLLSYPAPALVYPGYEDGTTLPSGHVEKPDDAELDPSRIPEVAPFGDMDFTNVTGTGRSKVALWVIQEGKVTEFATGSKDPIVHSSWDSKLSDFFSTTRELSPPPGIKIAIVHGNADMIVPLEGVKMKAEQWKAGGRNEVYLLSQPGESHAFDETFYENELESRGKVWYEAWQWLARE